MRRAIDKGGVYTMVFGKSAGHDGKVVDERVRVWVVDDQASFRRATAATLAAMDDFVMAGECETGETAIELIPDGDADIVLMDIHMPGMGGIEATRQIRAARARFDGRADVHLRRRGPSRCCRGLRRRDVPAQRTPVSRLAEPDMASRRLRFTSAAGSVPQWRAPKILLSRRSGLVVVGPRPDPPLPGRTLQVFLTGHLALWASAAILLPLWEYLWLLRSPWFLAFVAVGARAVCRAGRRATSGPARSVPAIDHAGLHRHLGQPFR